jgi:type II secretory pathway pseudopilin PulG
MSRHFWQACDRAAGFTFVELLVTIIVAGLAFAAMVPVFVGASEASSGDIVRNASLQLAQDKLEKIRGLDYDQIDQTALTDNTIPNGQFGTNVSWTTGGGGVRQFTVTYRVDYIGADGNAGATPGAEKYKQVTVTASWAAPPKPVRPVQLTTMISKQYAGPQIIRVNLGPTWALETDTTTNTTKIVGGPVTIDAYITPEDIASMNQTAPEANRGYILFTITPVNGTAIASQKVSLPVSTTDKAHYQYVWDNTGAPSGVYIIQAVAVAGFGSRSQGMPWSIALNYTNQSPPAPTNLAALPGDKQVTLTWTTAAAGNVQKYEVYRSLDGVTYSKLGEATTTTAYDDTGLTNGTTYYYKVRTVDANSLVSVFTAAVSAVPTAAADNVAPSIPSPLTAAAVTGVATVHLTWITSVDGGTPTSGLAGYNLERQQNGSSTWQPLQTLYQGIVYDDTNAAWGTTYTYRVCAVDLAGNKSAYAMSSPVTTSTLVLRQIVVTNKSTTQSYVWVQSAATSKWYTTSGTESVTMPSAQWVKKNNNSATWSNLPAGSYNVFFMKSTTFNLATNLLKSQNVDTGSANGVASYP